MSATAAEREATWWTLVGALAGPSSSILDSSSVATSPDGVTTFSCVTGGTTPPSGIVAILASERTSTFDDGTLAGEARTRFGADLAMTDNVFAYLDTNPSWQVMANVNLVMPGDPTCCPSQVVDAYYRLGNGVLELQDLQQEAGQGG